ncbi:MAG: c-type cytochrome biogenesis protein CcmI [Candidatus Thiodiazotropha sp. (ex Lucina aurantia)]|nr:c-type cytochrome biogenesis protein CcmI [Candidatus Thiodiazotropha sp. (ex Lucina pensylvanica)]MBT3023540.1 c-type cytochrome biogenesis protein CcmI [Candidatus Thiodiazotropha taylori]MBV2098585.1 c-type cytochrome biogenesis protein CcmI [Candidatus Thiodiazotropha sp. (ex Codakia orbicularis)]MBV2103602.1 c-type cytochrome biogenesis protein CcmI [Candidatus Thiodiazotropha sp. (ex Lucina aurantia)]MBV2117874.1 c-type cytochrome biogenesis protein CcmI [Candidatus Thiodiazotropha sp.
MTLFWIIIAGFSLLAMGFVALPLMRKQVTSGITSDELNLAVFKQQLAELDSDLKSGALDQTRYDAARRDLEKELLSDVSDQSRPAESGGTGHKMALLALVIPLAALLLYQFIGSPEIISRLANQPAATHTASAQSQGRSTQNLPPMEELVKRLAAKMQEQPDNQEGWIMLGRSYMAMNDPSAAINAFDRAMEISDKNVGLLLAYAEAIASYAGNDFTGRAAPMVEKALQLEPDNPNVLWIAGIVAYQRTDYQDAVDRWSKLRGLLKPQSAELESVNEALDDARSKLGLPAEETELPSIVQAKKQVPAEPAAAGDKSIQVEISLSPDMRDKANPDDLLFIYAKAMSGPPMPLAAVRKRVSDLPLSINLDDSMAMMPQMKLSQFPEVAVGARISLSGSPTAQSGDLEGEITAVSPGQPGIVKVVINSVHP